MSQPYQPPPAPVSHCTECGQKFGMFSGTNCTRCQWPRGAPGHLRQMVRVYEGNTPEKDFAREATELYRLGWMVANQSAAGFNSFKIGKKHAAAITVTYQRP